MTPTTLRFDKRLPIVWQNPRVLQVGVDPPRVVITDVDDTMLALIRGLRAGLTPTGIAMVAKECGVSPEDTHRFLDLLAPALEHHTEALSVPFVVDSERDTSGLRSVWKALGHDVFIHEGTSEAPLGEIVVVGDYVPHPDQHHRWLSLDRIHTLILFTDQSVIVGPRVQPGRTACLHCVRLRALEENPSSIAIASQLWGKQAPARTPELQALAAWHCYELIHRGEPGEVRRIDALTRLVTSSVSQPFHSCDCRGIC